MARRPAVGDWLAPAAAATTLLLVEVLRVWLPSVTFVFGRAGSTPATTMGLFAAVWFLLPLLLVPALRRAPSGVVFGVAGLALCAGRLALQATAGGDPQLWVATLSLLAGLVATVALAAGAASGHAARVGVLAGLLLGAVLHVALGTAPLLGRHEAPALVAIVALVVTCAVVILLAAKAPGWSPDVDRSGGGPAWPWLLTGPAVALVTMISAAPARLELAAGLSPGVVAAAVALAHLGGIGLALLGPSVRTAALGPLGGLLVLAGAAGGLHPVGALSVAALLAMPLGLGAVVGATASATGTSSPRRRAAATAVSWIAFLVVGFVYYAAYDMVIGVPNRLLLLLAAAGVAAVGLGTVAGARPAPTAPPGRRTLAGTFLALLVVAGIAGAGAARNLDASPPSATRSTGPLTLVLANIQMGYDVVGRHSTADQAELLVGLEPDVLVLNEVDRGWLLTGGHDDLRLLAAPLGLPREVFAPAADELWGNALLTHARVASRHVAALPREGAPMRRSLVSATLEFDDGTELGVVGTHLHHVTDEPEVRLRQLRAVAAEVARLRDGGLPVVVLGDLNAEPGAPELEPLEQLLDHALGPGHPTWPAWDPEVQIDHVLVSEDLEVLGAEVVEAEVSDHLFVRVEVAGR